MSVEIEQPQQVGFAGLGAMGFGMASNMLKAGIDVIAFDLNPAALKRFKDLGGRGASSLEEASTRCSKFFVMVATPAQVNSLVFELEEGALWKGLPGGAILCLFSTLPPDFVVQLKEQLERIGRADLRLLEAPVSGGAIGALKGALSIMVGGHKTTLAEIDKELATVSAPGRVFHCGDLGSAGTVKMLNQHLAGIHIVAAAEILCFAKVCGLSPREAYRIVQSSEGTSWIFGDRGISMLDANWAPRSAVTIFTKDLGIVVDSANSVSCPCPLASVAYLAFLERAAKGGGGDDDASVVCNYEEIIRGQVSEEKQDSNVPLTPPFDDTLEHRRLQCVIVSDRELSREKNSLSSTAFRTILEQPKLHPKDPSVLLWDCDEETSKQIMTEVLHRLPKSSIVVVVNDANCDDIHSMALIYPHIFLMDGHLIKTSDGSLKRLLFTATSPGFVASIRSSLPADIEAQPVTGDLGAATSMHLVTRIGSLIHIVAAAECYGLALAKGVSTQLVYSLIAGAAGSSYQFNEHFPHMMRRDFTMSSDCNTALYDRAMQDLNYLEKICASLLFTPRLLAATHQVFKAATKSGEMGHSTVAAVVRFWDIPLTRTLGLRSSNK